MTLLVQGVLKPAKVLEAPESTMARGLEAETTGKAAELIKLLLPKCAVSGVCRVARLVAPPWVLVLVAVRMWLSAGVGHPLLE